MHPSFSILDAASRSALSLDPLTRDRLSPSECEAYRREGFLVVRGALAPSAIAPLYEDVLAVLRARNAPASYLAQASEYLAGSPIAALVSSMRLASLACQAIEGGARLYLPFTAVKGPGQGPFTFHQDNSYTRLDGPACNCWFAISPMRIETGCLRMVPGSHRSGTLPAGASVACPGHLQVTEPATWSDLEMEPGDMVIFSRLTVHGSGSNRTQEPRVAYAVQYHREDVRAWLDGSWELLTRRPRWRVGPVERLSSEVGSEG